MSFPTYEVEVSKIMKFFYFICLTFDIRRLLTELQQTKLIEIAKIYSGSSPLLFIA